ncbi:hypothetical protein [Rhodoplanes sp. SY1]|uniref:hypothetical protein n=1 Tax=Rhodoplanes sp. SY1 TaxID=3166646 RepID=UPI0038B4F116
MTPDEIVEIGQDIAAALYARSREVCREARAAGFDDDFVRQIEALFRLAAETAVLRAVRRGALERAEVGPPGVPAAPVPERVH